MFEFEGPMAGLSSENIIMKKSKNKVDGKTTTTTRERDLKRIRTGVQAGVQATCFCWVNTAKK